MISQNIVFLSLKIYFVLANNADDEMPHYAVSLLIMDLHCLLRFPVSKGI